MGRAELIRTRAAERGLIASDELQQSAGITYRQLDHWCRIGLLDYEGGEDSGFPRMFQPVERDVAELLGRLSRCGLSPSSDLAQRAAIVLRAGRGEQVVTDGPLSVFL